MSDKIIHPNQRLKILYLYKILFEKTDENHIISMPQIISQLELYGIEAGRKALYEDIDALKLFGVDIITVRGVKCGYYIASRRFELPELKLLADAVTSSRFLTEKKSAELLKKIEGLTSINQGKQIRRQVFVADRVKSMNERIYLNVDVIQSAIADKKQISFRYFDYDLQKKKKYRDGIRECSPYAMTWNDEKYYLVAHYDKYPDSMTNFRVDRMDDVQVINKDIYRMPKNFKLSSYLNSTFSMFSGEATSVKMRFHKSLVNVVIDRFGKKITLCPDGDDYFTFRANINAQQPFFAWLFMLGENAEILEPQELKEQYAKKLQSMLKMLEG